METPKIDEKVKELRLLLSDALLNKDRVAVESYRGTLAELLLAKERIKAAPANG
jgi:Mg-chelatase subunit ChlD